MARNVKNKNKKGHETNVSFTKTFLGYILKHCAPMTFMKARGFVKPFAVCSKTRSARSCFCMDNCPNTMCGKGIISIYIVKRNWTVFFRVT